MSDDLKTVEYEVGKLQREVKELQEENRKLQAQQKGLDGGVMAFMRGLTTLIRDLEFATSALPGQSPDGRNVGVNPEILERYIENQRKARERVRSTLDAMREHLEGK